MASDSLWRLLESEGETRTRHLRETRDASEATAQAALSQVASLERLEDLKRAEASGREAERSFRQLREEARRAGERARPLQEAMDRRVLQRLADAEGIEDPLAPGRLKADSMGFSIEAQGWQEFAKWLRALAEAQGKFRDGVDEQCRHVVNTNATKLVGPSDELVAKWASSHVWSSLGLEDSEHVSRWVTRLTDVASKQLQDDPVMPALLAAAQRHIAGLVSRYEVLDRIIDEAVERRRKQDTEAEVKGKQARLIGLVVVAIGILVAALSNGRTMSHKGILSGIVVMAAGGLLIPRSSEARLPAAFAAAMVGLIASVLLRAIFD